METRIKGVSLVNLAEFVLAHHGEEGMRKVERALPPDAAKVFATAVAFEWYPLRTMIAIEAQIMDAFYGGDYTQGWRLGSFDMERNLSTIYKVLFRFLSPADVVARSGKVFHTFVDQGAVEVIEHDPRRFTVRFPGLHTQHPVYCHDLLGSLRGTLAACGVKSPDIVHSACCLQGAPACTYDVSWS